MMRRPASRSDAELFAATPENPQAFGEFYRRHEQAVLRFFLYWTRLNWAVYAGVCSNGVPRYLSP